MSLDNFKAMNGVVSVDLDCDDEKSMAVNIVNQYIKSIFSSIVKEVVDYLKQYQAIHVKQFFQQKEDFFKDLIEILIFYTNVD